MTPDSASAKGSELRAIFVVKHYRTDCVCSLERIP